MLLRILLALFFCIYMLALSIVNNSMGVFLFGTGVLILGTALCKRTNWMDKEEGDEKP